MSPRSSRYPGKVAAIFHGPSAGRAAAASIGDLADDKRLLCKIRQSSDGHSVRNIIYIAKRFVKIGEILEEIL